MRVLPQIIMLLFACFCLAYCGGPAEWDGGSSGGSSGSSGSSGGTTNLTDNPCYTNTGPDCDQDGLSDECEEHNGTPKCDADCDDDGISDRFDDINECPGNEDQECDIWCQAQQAGMAQALYNDMLASWSSTRQRAPEGYNVQLDNQILILGALSHVTTDFFKSATNLNRPPLLQGSDECEDPANFFFMANGTIQNIIAGTDPIPAYIEYCGKLDATHTQLATATDSVTLPDIVVQEWTKGATLSTAFNPKALESDNVEGTTTLKGMHLMDPKSVGESTLYDNMEFEMEQQITFFDMTEDGGIRETTGEVETFAREWKRTGNQATQMDFSSGFLGLWTSCGGVFDPNCL